MPRRARSDGSGPPTLTCLRSAVGRLRPSRARAFSVAAAEAEASDCRASTAAPVAAGSGLGVWLLSSNPQPLMDSGLAEDAAAAGSGGNNSFLAAFGDVAANGEREGRFLFGDSYRQRVFFKYEKRIRTRSPLDKIFEYFASVHSPEGEIYVHVN